ncbi:hypothetical protein QBC38DRAFT_14486 [Podospora fimiseda]|uniref:Uncharacterized protein n=1 Tax=Podospora fimiseda TaxID=252190 RepID=A0AAN7BJP6_9PEZI|nr:hypothetical protein QBC38DRAFT_14486 [Podospora fimiseda]
MSGQKESRDGEGQGKGKEKEKDVVQSGLDDINTPEQSSPSAFSRIAQSAAALPSSLFSGPPGPEVSSLGANGKGAPSAVGQALARAGESSVQIRPNIPSGGTLRPGHAREQIAKEEASFAAFLDSDDVPMLSEPGRLEGAWQQSSSTPATEASLVLSDVRQLSRSVLEQMTSDGADVVALLSADDPLEPDFGVDEGISPEDLSSLRKALFDGTSSGVAWDSILNFIPDYLHPQLPADSQQTGNLVLHLGTRDASEAWDIWVDQWARVLTDYQDEVWGDLGALVNEARAEVKKLEEVKPGDKPTEPTALLRLRAILGHLRGF